MYTCLQMFANMVFVFATTCLSIVALILLSHVKLNIVLEKCCMSSLEIKGTMLIGANLAHIRRTQAEQTTFEEPIGDKKHLVTTIC